MMSLNHTPGNSETSELEMESAEIKIEIDLAVDPLYIQKVEPQPRGKSEIKQYLFRLAFIKLSFQVNWLFRAANQHN